ncbi:MAG: hypothetical protein ACFFB5_24705 [Promethearchaeota archaeon]
MSFHRCDFLRGKYWHTYQSMESRLSTISRYILIDPDNNEVYSEELAEFLISIGSAFDTFFRNMMDCPDLAPVKTRLGVTKKSEDMDIVDYRKVTEDYIEFSSMTIQVPFGLGKRQDIFPFKEFKQDKSPLWWKSYNHVKHDYFTNIKEANLINVLNGLGALLLLNIFHQCNRLYLMNIGAFYDANGILSVEDARMAFIYDIRGTTGYTDPENFVFIRTPTFFYRFQNYEP